MPDVDRSAGSRSSVNDMLTLDRLTEREAPVMSNTYENTEYAAMMSRMIRGLGRRVSDGDPSDLADAVALQRQLDETIRAAVADLRSLHGFSWQQLADELGCTKQAAQQRYGGRK